MTEHPDDFGPALAHVITMEGETEVVLGQAWIAGPNKLVTCGHVVDQFAFTPQSLIVKFPTSGNRYSVRGVRLHPSFVRQPDQLVKFDAAVLFVELNYPEREVNPLPIIFEKPVPLQTPLSTIRYPVHLSQLTSTPAPLAQMGRMLGALRKHDNFHLLHDLALAPGDSGAPLLDGSTVVAMHCGDTATLPGLNLPTTSIRLALWVDALRDLGINETQVAKKGTSLAQYRNAILAFLCAFVIMVVLSGWLVYSNRNHEAEKIEQPKILPLVVSFNRPFTGYKFGENAKITITPQSTCYLYVYCVGVDGQVYKLFPVYGDDPYITQGNSRTIERIGKNEIKVSDSAGDKLHFLALNSKTAPLDDGDLATEDKSKGSDPMIGSKMRLNAKQFEERIRSWTEKDKSMLHMVLDVPTATPVN